jgi:mono/diheme cytochrome c family protein
MKRLNYIQAILTLTIVIAVAGSCGVKREPGSAYMPDMAYSRAYETYIQRDSTFFTMSREEADRTHKIFYNNRPVAGTMRMGELNPYGIPNDSVGYAMSASIKNPLPALSSMDSAEAGRLFNINCAICHGVKATGDGPIYDKIGAVANLTQEKYVAMADGTMFHSVTYGKGNMGSYASQLSRQQRWMIIQYVRTLQPKAGGAKAGGDSTAKATTATTAAADTAKAKGIN